MTTTETPVADTESGEPAKTVPKQSPAEATVPAVKKGMKASTGERVLIGILLAVVIAVAIAAVTVTLVRESRKGSINDDDYVDFDDYAGFWEGEDTRMPFKDYIDDAFDDVFNDTFDGERIGYLPFADDASLFSFDVTEPYASIEELRKDIEALVKTYANEIILEEANLNNHDDDDVYAFHSAPVDFDMAMPMPVAATNAAPPPSNEMRAPSNEMSGVNDFETYQHEAGVVKSDRVKSNGAHVFAAVNDRIEVWDLESNLLDSTTIIGSDSSRLEWTDNGYAITINSLLMNPEGNKLIVIAQDRGMEFPSDSLIDSVRETQISVFAIEEGSLTELSKTYIDGYFVNAYSVGSIVHVVTKMRLRTWIIDDELYRYKHRNEYVETSTNEEYVIAAKRKAEEIMPKFVDKMIDLFTEDDEIILSRLVGFPDSVNAYKSITQLSSFDMSDIDGDGVKLHASKSLVLQPGHTEYVYATEEWIWVSDENTSWDLEKQSHVAQTMLLGFRLDGASSRFEAVGSVPGQLLSQFSIDFVNDDEREYIRMAVTQEIFRNRWWWRRSLDQFESEDLVEGSRTINEIIILEVPKVEDSSQKISELVKLGSVEVGKKDELITAVRFFDNVSYVVTFERTDPFYVLDLSDPMNPKVLGELEVPGFSQFMHPIKEDNSMLLTVGRDADNFGRDTGFQISIFDSAIPTDPKLVDRLVIGGDGSSTSSSSSFDERAFRYFQVGDVGRLVIPLSSWSYRDDSSFDGFSVFAIDLSKTERLITRELDIDHEGNNFYDSRGCFCGSVYLPERSFVFDGNLMTLKNAHVVSTDLVSQETKWNLNMVDTEECCMP